MFLAAALWKRREMRFFNTYLSVTNILMVVAVAILMGAGGFVKDANVGLVRRIFALVSLPRMGVAAYVLGIHEGTLGRLSPKHPFGSRRPRLRVSGWPPGQLTP
jgi:hypothetical protein